MITGLRPAGTIDLSAETWSSPLLLAGTGIIVAAARDGTIAGFSIRSPARGSLWKHSVGSAITASPSVHVGTNGLTCAIGSHDGRLTAFDPITGTLFWTRELGGMIRSTAAFSSPPSGESRIYVASYGDYVWCVDVETGARIWRRWLPPQVWARLNGVVSSPMVKDVDGDGKLEVVLGTRSFRIYCLDAETGALRWFQSREYGIDSTATLVPDPTAPKIVVGTGESLNGRGDRSIVALYGINGRTAWRFQAKGGFDSSASVSSDGTSERVYQTSLADASCYCVDAHTGELVWRFRFGPTARCRHDDSNVCIAEERSEYFTADARCRSYTTPVIADIDGDGRLEVLAGSCNGILYCLDSASGELVGSADTEGMVRGSPTLGDVDGDGVDELVVPSGSRLLVYRTQSRGTKCGGQRGGGAPITGVETRSRGSEHTALRPPFPPVERSLLFLRWALLDLMRYVATRIDKHLLDPLGLRVFDFWY